MQKIHPRAVVARVRELGEKVQAQELKCVEVLRRADEVIKRAHTGLERSERRVQHSRELRRTLASRRTFPSLAAQGHLFTADQHLQHNQRIVIGPALRRTIGAGF